MKRSAGDDDKRTPGSRKSLRSVVLSEQAGFAEREAGETHEPGAPSSDPQHARVTAEAATRSNDEQRSAEQEPAAAAAPVSYPNPRNFVERLMLVLQTNAAPDTISWIEDGKAVALTIDNLKEGTVLREHFRGIKYKFFIRNFSRWGFRRNTGFSVPCGQFHYRNSLFQRDRPHLVVHMRRDSDVQDIFAEHEAETEAMKSSEVESQQQTSSSSVAEPASSSETAADQRAQPPAPDDAANWNGALMQQLIGLLAEQSTSQQDQQSYRDPVSSQPQHQENMASRFSQIERPIVHQHQNQDNTTRGELDNPENTLLQGIVDLSNQYLRVPPNQSVADDFVLRSVVQAVEEVGRRRLEEVAQRQRFAHEQPAPAAALVQHLMHNFSGATASTDPQQEGGIQHGRRLPQVDPNQSAPRRPDSNISGMVPQHQVQDSAGPQQQQQHEQGQGNPPAIMLDNETAARLQEYLMSLVQPSPQVQGNFATSGGPYRTAQHPSQQVSSSVYAPPPTPDPTAFINALLLTVIRQWSGHQQQQQQLDEVQVPGQHQNQHDGGNPDGHRRHDNRPSSG